MPFWILLFIICLPKTGSIGENLADHGQGKFQQITATIPTMPFLKPTISGLHDARHFWRQGHKTFSGLKSLSEKGCRENRHHHHLCSFISKKKNRSREETNERGEAGERGGRKHKPEKIKTGGVTQRTQ